MELEKSKAVDRVIGIAGGSRKLKAIRGALRGSWINILVTDSCTTEQLVNAHLAWIMIKHDHYNFHLGPIIPNELTFPYALGYPC